MKLFATIALLAPLASVSALAPRNAQCCFKLSASGGKPGTAGQISDGQVRIGGNLNPTTFCIKDSGAITDSNGRGCILTKPESQFQCDAGVGGQSGFSIGCDGTFSYNGNPGFFACPTGPAGNFAYNIYTQSVDSSCVRIALKADGCAKGCSPSPNPGGCPANLNGPYEYPHLIVPVNSAHPDQASGTSYFGEVSSSISTLFNFDVPASDNGKKCSLVFLFPEQKNLVTSSFTFSGNGAIDFSLLGGVANQGTTFHNAPEAQTDYGVTTVSPGHSYLITTFSCPAGKAMSFELKAVGDTALRYFQDYNPSPIGLYITKC